MKRFEYLRTGFVIIAGSCHGHGCIEFVFKAASYTSSPARGTLKLGDGPKRAEVLITGPIKNNGPSAAGSIQCADPAGRSFQCSHATRRPARRSITRAHPAWRPANVHYAIGIILHDANGLRTAIPVRAGADRPKISRTPAVVLHCSLVSRHLEQR